MSDRRYPAPLVEFPPSQFEAGGGSPLNLVLAAYVQAEQTKTFRQLLWRRLTVAAVGWALLGFLHVVPTSGIILGLSLFVAIGAGAGALERRAGRRVVDLLSASMENRGG